jgi:hypothetical protein
MVFRPFLTFRLSQSIASKTPAPALAICTDILLSILKAMAKAQENNERLYDLAKKAVEVVAAVSHGFEGRTPSGRMKRHLNELERCVWHENKRLTTFKRLTVLPASWKIS